MNWIQEVLHSTAESESPERYFYWSAIAAISAATRRRTYLERHYYRLYPNLYIFLIGPSGVRKSVPINLATKLIDKVDCTRVLNGRSSIQAIIKELGKAYTCNDQSIITDAIGFLIAPELDTMLVKDEAVPTLLMDMYDTFTKDKWKNTLVGKDNRGDSLKNVYLTLLGASNETNLLLALPRSATDGGLVSRTVVVLEERKRLLNSLINKPKVYLDIRHLSTRLTNIANLAGEFTFDNVAASFFDAWYNSFMTLESMDRTGTLDRIPDMALKVAMCLSMASKDELVLCKCELEEAIDKCMECVVGMRKVFLASGEHDLAKPTAKVLRILIKRQDHKISRAKLLQQLYGEADAIDLNRIIGTYDEAGAIVITNIDGETFYELKPEVIDQFKSFVKDQEGQ